MSTDTLLGFYIYLTSSPPFSAGALQDEDSQVVTFLVPASLSVASMPWHCRSYTNSTGVNSRVPLGMTLTLGTGQQRRTGL